jgi:L,D-peptidoglycan transpeptidase YkuD (ErfK/YbiS/YcfS/YnhG family)
MDLEIFGDGLALWHGRRMRCAVGRSGVRMVKHEGDGATPAGRWAMRWLYYRPDRLPPPPTRLARTALGPGDGWCDAPDDRAYNQPVRLPYPASAEKLWRDDTVYNLIVPLAYNDAPAVPGAGSAIFLHLARPQYEPTEGCVALALADLLAVLAEAGPLSHVIVRPTATR